MSYMDKCIRWLRCGSAISGLESISVSQDDNNIGVPHYEFWGDASPRPYGVYAYGGRSPHAFGIGSLSAYPNSL